MDSDEHADSLLEHIALELVMLSPSAREGAERVRTLLESLRASVGSHGPRRLLVDEAISRLAQLPEDEAACQRELQTLSALLERLQAAGPEVADPAEPVPDVVDDALREEFLAGQEAVLEEFEAHCLALGSGETERRAPILRQLHTWKGEAGLLGLHDLGRTLHAVEEVLQNSPELPPTHLADGLLALQDQLATYFSRRRQRETMPLLDPVAAAALFQAAPPAPETSRPATDSIPNAPVFALPDELDLELMQEFLAESAEHMQGAEAALMSLESHPEDLEAVNTVFRAFHTIKGVASFLGVGCITEFAHKAETFFDRVRKGQLTLAGAYTDLSFEALDVLKGLLKALPGAVETGQLVAPAAYERLRRQLEQPEAVAAPTPAAVTPVVIAAAAASEPPATDAPAAAPAARGSAKALDTEGAVKVSTGRLDNLINLVGELVIAQAMVSQDPLIQAGTDQRLLRNVNQLAKITRSLQELALSMRMISVKASFQKMARLVRDLARKSGKEIEFETAGEDTELDRNMVEAIADPLVHMVRNAVDHGVEPPAERAAAGKPRAGRVRLAAAHEGGSVVITLSDDGRGLDPEKILRKAVERGLVAAGATPPEGEIFRLIFQPGFSTAEKVTDISGRGVGMDVVRTNIEALRGAVEISSQPGRGTTFHIRLPLTLAIIDGMVVRAGHERFIIPMIAITESVQPDPQALTGVHGRRELVNLRGELVPILRLGRAFQISGTAEAIRDGILVVVGSKGRRAALLVDQLLGQQQVVIKSLGQALGQVRGVSGGAILGDGRVALILDVDGLLTERERRDSA